MIRKSRDRERGAALVEFAVLAPLLILLVLGIVEFGWKFGQFNDVRHAAREGARFAAVDGGDNNAIYQQVCQTMDALSAGLTSIDVTLDPDVDANGETNIGEQASISVTATVDSLSGVPLITPFLPSTLTSDIEFRLEQTPSWTAGTGTGITC